jgi:hypothetical protein
MTSTSELQREALAVLAEVRALSPDVRLGQLFAHLGFLGEAHLGRVLGVFENDELMSNLLKHRAELLARSPNRLPSTGAGGRWRAGGAADHDPGPVNRSTPATLA